MVAQGGMCIALGFDFFSQKSNQNMIISRLQMALSQMSFLNLYFQTNVSKGKKKLFSKEEIIVQYEKHCTWVNSDTVLPYM